MGLRCSPPKPAVSRGCRGPASPLAAPHQAGSPRPPLVLLPQAAGGSSSHPKVQTRRHGGEVGGSRAPPQHPAPSAAPPRHSVRGLGQDQCWRGAQGPAQLTHGASQCQNRTPPSRGGLSTPTLSSQHPKSHGQKLPESRGTAPEPPPVVPRPARHGAGDAASSRGGDTPAPRNVPRGCPHA